MGTKRKLPDWKCKAVFGHRLTGTHTFKFTNIRSQRVHVLRSLTDTCSFTDMVENGCEYQYWALSGN